MKKILIGFGASIVLIVSLYFIAWHYLNAKYDEGYKAAMDKVQAEQLANKQVKQEKADASNQRDFENEQKLHSIIADSNATIISLRNVIEQDSKRQSETIAQANARTTTYREFFLECSTRYSDMAGQADEVNIVAHGLQGYVQAINK